jgi:Tfp pilus assembly ATPase PilU
MDQSLTELVKSGAVEPNEALDRAIDKESFKQMIAALEKKPAAV